ncbi:MAG TPA: hypothetical protein VJX67_10570 [Blastocatellia bacterium]|nr:hypothetical protein [Blastocatellia bacterium]
MRECPVCKESFADEFNFCDLDGAPLDGNVRSVNQGGGASRVWSVLGVGLLLSAVGITAAAIIFFPRGPSAPQFPANRPQPLRSSPAAPQSAGAPVSSESKPDELASTERPPEGKANARAALTSDAARADARNAARRTKDEEDNSSNPNPKAAVGVDDGSVKPAVDDAADTRPRVARDPAPTSGADPASPPAVPSPDGSTTAKKEAKHRPSSTQSGDPDTGNKKPKKKGGFLKVFKKIFGQG